MLEEENKIPFTSHLEELRTRLIHCFIAIVIGFAISYGFKEKIFEILTKPLITIMGSGNKLIFTSLPEAFFTYLKVALLSGIMLATPVLLYEFWIFIAPGLYKKEKKVLFPIIILCSFFFIAGSLFGYFFVFPYGFKFFMGFASETIMALPSMKEYLTLASKLLIAFGLVFEMPLIITSMAKLGIVTSDFLKKNRKYALLLFFVFAAILTPPDVITQVMMAIPLMFLYELSIVGAKLFGKKKSDDKTEELLESDIDKT